MTLLTKRIYENFEPSDGFRVLADRLWPRGIKKEDAHLNLWAKEITPSNDLRKWFHENLEMYNEFRTKYLAELKSNPDFEDFLNDIRDHDVVILLTAAKDVEHCHIPILVEFIEQKMK